MWKNSISGSKRRLGSPSSVMHGVCVSAVKKNKLKPKNNTSHLSVAAYGSVANAREANGAEVRPKQTKRKRTIWCVSVEIVVFLDRKPLSRQNKGNIYL